MSSESNTETTMQQRSTHARAAVQEISSHSRASSVPDTVEQGLVNDRKRTSYSLRNKNEFLAGVAVSLTMVPTSVAFAFLAELSPQKEHANDCTAAWVLAELVTAVESPQNCPHAARTVSAV
eukprot:16615-Heterococcus_DN1.PRE.8